MERITTLAVLALLALVSTIAEASTRVSSAYCCPDGSSSTIQKIETRTRVVRFTHLVKTGEIIIGYRKSANCKAGMEENLQNSTLPALNSTTAVPLILNTTELHPIQSETNQQEKRSVIKQILKRFWLFGRNKESGDIVYKQRCPIYKDIMEPIVAYKHETYEVPVHEAGCPHSEQVCCEGYTRTVNNECHNEHDAKAFENPNVKNVLSFLG